MIMPFDEQGVGSLFTRKIPASDVRFSDSGNEAMTGISVKRKVGETHGCRGGRT